MVMGYQYCFAINFLILIKYNIFLWDNFSSHDNHSTVSDYFYFYFINPRFGVMDIQSLPSHQIFCTYLYFLDKSIFNSYQIFFCKTVNLYMIIGFLLPKILPPLFLLVFKFKLNYKFIQSTNFIFIFYKILVKWLESFSKQVTTPKLKLSIIDFYFYFNFYNKFMFNATYQIIFYVRIFLYMIIGFLFFFF